MSTMEKCVLIAFRGFKWNNIIFTIFDLIALSVWREAAEKTFNLFYFSHYEYFFSNKRIYRSPLHSKIQRAYGYINKNQDSRYLLLFLFGKGIKKCPKKNIFKSA